MGSYSGVPFSVPDHNDLVIRDVDGPRVRVPRLAEVVAHRQGRKVDGVNGVDKHLEADPHGVVGGGAPDCRDGSDPHAVARPDQCVRPIRCGAHQPISAPAAHGLLAEIPTVSVQSGPYVLMTAVGVLPTVDEFVAQDDLISPAIPSSKAYHRVPLCVCANRCGEAGKGVA